MLDPSIKFTALIFIATAILLRKHLYNWFDPMLVTIFCMAASVGSALDYYFDWGVVDGRVVFLLVIAHFGYVAGVLLGERHNVRLPIASGRRIGVRQARVLAIGSVIATALVCVYFAWTTGAKLLEVDMTTQRTELYMTSSGVYRRLITGITVLSIAIVAVSRYKKRLHAGMSATLLLLLAAIGFISGGKGALWSFYLVYAYIGIFAFKMYGVKLTLVKRLFLISAFAATFAGAFLLLYIGNAKETTAPGQKSVEDLQKRIVASGDISTYYFASGVYTTFNKPWTEYFKVLGNSIGGPLRLQEYMRPVGAELSEASSGVDNDQNTGPNAQVCFVGFIYFGWIGGIVYSVIIGIVVGALRRFVNINYNTTDADMIVFIIANGVITIIPMDVSYFLQEMYTRVVLLFIMFFFFVPRARPEIGSNKLRPQLTAGNR